MAFEGTGAGGKSLALPTQGAQKPDPLLQPALANALSLGGRPGTVFQGMSPAGSKAGVAPDTGPGMEYEASGGANRNMPVPEDKGPSPEYAMALGGTAATAPGPTKAGPSIIGKSGSVMGKMANPFKYVPDRGPNPTADTF